MDNLVFKDKIVVILEDDRNIVKAMKEFCVKQGLIFVWLNADDYTSSTGAPYKAWLHDMRKEKADIIMLDRAIFVEGSADDEMSNIQGKTIADELTDEERLKAICISSEPSSREYMQLPNGFFGKYDLQSSDKEIVHQTEQQLLNLLRFVLTKPS